MSILKNQLPNSTLGLKGATPNKRVGAVAPTGLHVDLKTKAQLAGHSNLDLDGQTPDKYLDNAPE